MLTVAFTATQVTARKVLCLHGGGQPASSFQSDWGMMALRNQLPDWEFVFADGPEVGHVWLRDPPSKEDPTNDPDWDEASRNYLDGLVSTQGPFDAILGYSQGAAYTLTYLSWAPAGTFQAALLFCGYVPTTHLAMVNRINSRAPLNLTSGTLVFHGANDPIVSTSMSQEAASKFTNPTMLNSPVAGHNVPYSSDPTFGGVVAFMNAITGSENGGEAESGDKKDGEPYYSKSPHKAV